MVSVSSLHQTSWDVILATLSTFYEPKNRSRKTGYAPYALSQIGPDAEPAIPHLSELLDDEVRDVRECAGYALRKIRANDTAAAGQDKPKRWWLTAHASSGGSAAPVLRLGGEKIYEPPIHFE